MKQLALIVPSRGRPHNIKLLLQSLQDTHIEDTDLILSVDDDDPFLGEYQELEPQLAHLLIAPRQGIGAVKPLNRAVLKFLDDYEFFVFAGDDQRPSAEFWDKRIVAELRRLCSGITYGNDLHQGEGLPTVVAMTSNIIRAMGGLLPPSMTHLFADNFILRLGKDIESITYLPDVVFEHFHPVFGTAEWDEGYRAVNSSEMYELGAREFNEYINSPAYAELLAKLKK